MSRLLTMLLLCKAGHAPVVCALTSVVMKKCQEVYAGALTAACGVWSQGWSYPMLFAGAMLEMLGDAYVAFNDMRRMLDGVVAPLAKAVKAMFGGLGGGGHGAGLCLPAGRGGASRRRTRPGPARNWTGAPC